MKRNPATGSGLASRFRLSAGDRLGFGVLLLSGWIGIALPAATAQPSTPPSVSVVTNATASFTNTLGMVFVALHGTNVWFSVWETRVQDFEVFMKETTLRTWNRPSFEQGPTHPAVNLNWEDAEAFCRWLTGRERDAGTIRSGEKYRLPTDAEWSTAVGLKAEQGATPEVKQKRSIVWPWGSQWPPLPGAGNYAPELKVDIFAKTAPVGRFPPNALGLFDVGGNVWEWCDDWYNPARVMRTLRGGSWAESQPGYLLAAYRFHGTMNLSNDDIGFRVVLAGRER